MMRRPSPISASTLGCCRALRDVGYETPSPIQAEAIPPLLAGHHVVGLAQTGTGKTAAFALPILSRVDVAEKSPQALVLTPTRELALQVAEAFERYAAHLKGLHVLPVYGGQGYGVQLSALRRGVHVVVGTPGRVTDHLHKGTLDLSSLRFAVLDEADEMLNMGFAEDVEQILSATPELKQVALFSATIPAQIRRIAREHAPDAVEVTVKGRTATAANVTQRYLKVRHAQKLDALTRILEVENFDALIVFVRTKQATEELAERLRARGFSAAAINGDVAQQQRERTIDQLRKGSLDILVATDVAARGLDVERVSHVVNHDIPTDTESYVHRIGRTGRAGRAGAAISLRHAAREGTCCAPSRRPTGDGWRRWPCRAWRTSTPPGSRRSPRRSPPRSATASWRCSVSWCSPTRASTTSRPRTSPRRSPCSPRAASRCCWTRRRRRPRRERTAAHRPVDLADRGRPQAPRRATADRRRARQRGRAVAQGLRPHRHPQHVLPGGAARRPAAEDARGPGRHLHLRRADRPPPGPARRPHPARIHRWRTPYLRTPEEAEAQARQPPGVTFGLHAGARRRRWGAVPGRCSAGGQLLAVCCSSAATNRSHSAGGGSS